MGNPYINENVLIMFLNDNYNTVLFHFNIFHHNRVVGHSRTDVTPYTYFFHHL